MKNVICMERNPPWERVIIIGPARRRGLVNKTGIVRDKKYMEHWMGEYHPESPMRLEAINGMLNEPDMVEKFVEVPARPADKKDIMLVHSSGYVERIESTAGVEYTYLDPDTQTCAASYDAALLAAGGVCQAIGRVYSGELHNAFALVRPPGHHAERAQAKGFCLFNNVAVGARYAQKNFGTSRILIVDWDLHHGNGTQHSFEEDPSVLYFSTHQYPYYPGSGAFDEVGRGRGTGFTVNVPLTIGHGDGEYLTIYDRVLRPIALQYRPELILVSAGFDTYYGDPLGGMNVTPKGFAGLVRVIMDLADQCCGGKVVLTLEGGYNILGERDSVKEVLKEMAGLSVANPHDIMALANPEMIDYLLDRVKTVQSRYWEGLKA
jgi:acetoin utilization deacetylase AcuC-like enzyme